MSIRRATMRARTGGTIPATSTGYFVPQVPWRLFRGASEMSIVVIARLRTGGSVAGNYIDLFEANNGPFGPGPLNAGGFEFGYDGVTTAPTPEVYLGAVDAAGAFHYGEGRGMVLADEGKIHRFVGVGAIAGTVVGGAQGLVACYVNGINDGHVTPGFDNTLPSFLPAQATPDVNGVLGSTGNFGGMIRFDVMDIATIDRAFTATEVKDLDTYILATKQLPAFAWVEHHQAERLVNHSRVLDAGGGNTGRGWIATGAAPILSAVEITPQSWGGVGT